MAHPPCPPGWGTITADARRVRRRRAVVAHLVITTETTMLHLPRHWVKAYEAGEASSFAIARAVGSSETTVLRALRREGVAIRRPGTGPGVPRVEVPEHLAEAYRDGRISVHRIARTLGRSDGAVRRALRRLGLSTTDYRRRRAERPGGEVPEHLAEAYRDGRITIPGIARTLGRSNSAVYNVLRRLGFNTAGYRQRLAERNRTIVEAYRSGKSICKLAERFQITRQRVFQILQAAARSGGAAREAPTERGPGRARGRGPQGP
jgi:IS30 family transposase